MGQENAVTCPHCDERRSVLSRSFVRKTPEHLIVAVKRIDWKNGGLVKDCRTVDFDSTFTLPPPDTRALETLETAMGEDAWDGAYAADKGRIVGPFAPSRRYGMMETRLLTLFTRKTTT